MPLEELGSATRMGVLPTVVFVVTALLSVAVYVALLQQLYALSEYKLVTTAQLAAAIGYGGIVALWAGTEAGFFVARMQPRYESVSSGDDESELDADEKASLSPVKGGSRSEPSIVGIKPSHLPALRLCAEFVAIMGYIYFCDRTTVVAKGPKYQSKTAFWMVNLAILGVAALTVRGMASSSARDDLADEHVKPLQRDQTEEWKGCAACRATRPRALPAGASQLGSLPLAIAVRGARGARGARGVRGVCVACVASVWRLCSVAWRGVARRGVAWRGVACSLPPSV